jgi:phosphoserine aminotransferase
MNLAAGNMQADYIDTGIWASKAIQEAKNLGKNVRIIASSRDRDYRYVPTDIRVTPTAAYVHFTSNNTIKGTQFSTIPESGDVPLVSDMSSDIMSRVFDPRPFGLIYAGAQKNLGPAGVCLAIVREDMLERTPQGLPTMHKYTTFVEKNSLFNTPPVFAIYTLGLVMKWLEETVGGLREMEKRSEEKAQILYRVIDDNDLYYGTVEPESRSKATVTFRLTNQGLEKKFLRDALNQGLAGLQGHRSVGGCRAALYNGTEVEAVHALAEFMEDFARKHG